MKTVLNELGKGHYVQGRWMKGKGPSFESHDPATGMSLWEGAAATSYEVNGAVEAARIAVEEWSITSLEERIAVLNSFGKNLKQSKSILTLAISKETGKPLWDAANEVEAMIGKVAISIEAYHHRSGILVRELSHGKSITRHKPHGVAVVLGPFNFPGHLPNGHIIPALLAGNTLVFKPSEYTPQVAELTLECWHKTGIPEGVINMIQGGQETGKALVQHPNIDALFFTGSYRTGKILSELFGSHPEKILALEMGGNNPLVVTQIKDLKAAAFLTLQSAFLSSGQRCTCARRLIVLKGDVGDAFLSILQELVKSLHVGAYTDTPEPFMGPVISEKVALELLDKQERWEKKGGRPICKMQLLKKGTGLLSPGIIDLTEVVDRDDEEIFGPLLQLIRVPNLQAAIVEANRTSYGLSAGLISESREEYELFYQKVKAGIVNWNAPLTGASSSAPFGGVGKSGNHRPSAYYAADYCSFPVASTEAPAPLIPAVLPPGIMLPS